MPLSRRACRCGSESYLRSPRRIPGRCRGWPIFPLTIGTPSTSGRSWVTSWRLAGVTENARGTRPLPSTKRWCLEPYLRRSTGLGPVFFPAASRVWRWNRSPPATIRFCWPPGVCSAAPRADASIRRACSNRAGDASRSCRCRSPFRAEAGGGDEADVDGAGHGERWSMLSALFVWM